MSEKIISDADWIRIAAQAAPQELAEKIQEIADDRDRLARALASVYGEQDHTICPACDELGHDLSLSESHQPGCMFWWATEHVESLKD